MTRWFDSVTRENNQEDVDTVLYPLEIWMICHYIELCQRTRLCSHKSKRTTFFLKFDLDWFWFILINSDGLFQHKTEMQKYRARREKVKAMVDSPQSILISQFSFYGFPWICRVLGSYQSSPNRPLMFATTPNQISTFVLGKGDQGGHCVLLFHSFDLFNVFVVLVLGMVWKSQYAAEMSWNLSKIDTHGAIDSMIIFPLWECKA